MAIDVRLQDERGSTLEKVPYPWGVPERWMPSDDDRSFTLLHEVDPYGDTVLSQQQMPGFLAEWRRLTPNAQTADERQFLERVEALAERCLKEPGLFLKFEGD